MLRCSFFSAPWLIWPCSLAPWPAVSDLDEPRCVPWPCIFSAGAFFDAGFDWAAGLWDPWPLCCGAPCAKAVPEPTVSAAAATAISNVFFLMVMSLLRVPLALLLLSFGPPRMTRTNCKRLTRALRIGSGYSVGVWPSLLPHWLYENFREDRKSVV